MLFVVLSCFRLDVSCAVSPFVIVRCVLFVVCCLTLCVVLGCCGVLVFVVARCLSLTVSCCALCGVVVR